MKKRAHSFYCSAFLVFFIFNSVGCFDPGRANRAIASRLPVPTKDEVLVVDGRALSISGYLVLRSQLRLRDKEGVFFAAAATLALQNDSRLTGSELSPKEAFDIVRYALDDGASPELQEASKQYFKVSSGRLPDAATLRKQLSLLVTRSVVQRNPQVLAELN